MRLYSIEITNFRVIRHAVLNLPDCVIGIVGPNGAGKSTLVEAIAWALYGNQVARSGRDEIKSQGAGRNDPCEVSLEFGVAGEKFRVVRRLAGRGERPEVELYRGEAAESVGVVGTRDYIGRLLGLDFRGFLTSFLARQQELNALSDLPPAKRRDHLAGMLGIERLDKAMAQVKEDSKRSADRIAFMEKQLLSAEHVRERIRQLTEQMAELEGQKGVRATALEQAESSLKQAGERLASEQEARSSWLQLKATIGAAETSLKSQQDQWTALQDEMRTLERMKADHAALMTELEELPRVRSEVRSRETARETVELRQRAEAQALGAKGEVGRLEKEQRVARKGLSELEAALSGIPGDIEKRLARAEQALEMSRGEYLRREADRKARESEIGKLRGQMDSILQLGAESVCDRCLRPLGDDMPTIRKHLENELSELVSVQEESKERLARIREEGKKVRESVTGLAEQASIRRESLARKSAVLATLESVGTSLQMAEAQFRELTRQIEGMAAVAFDATELDRQRARLSRLEASEAEYNRLSGRLDAIPALRARIEATAERVSAAREEVRSLNQKRGDLDYREEAYTEAADCLQRARAAHETERDRFRGHQKELELRDEELSEALKLQATYEAAEEELDNHREDRYYREKLAGLLAEFRGQLVTRIRPTLADLSGRLFAEMTGGRYDLVELDSKYNLRLMDGGEFFGIERFSGGEKDLANLCLRLAISQALTDAAGLDRSFVILDEVFGSQDTDRRDLIIRALGNLKSRFPQVLLITHIADIRDRVEMLVEVEPTGYGYSVVKCS